MTEDGEFNYIINREALDMAVNRRFDQQEDFAMRGEFNSVPTAPAKLREQIRLEIIEDMTPISREVNQSITIPRNLDHATAVNAESRRQSNVKLQFFDSLGWLQAFNYASTP